MKTFFEMNVSRTKTFVLYGNLQDTIWCPDLIPRDIEHYLVKLLKSQEYEHIIFYGGAGTRGAYCLDEESARFFFSPNRDIPLPQAISEEVGQAPEETAADEKEAKEEAGVRGPAAVGTGVSRSQVSDALDSLFDDLGPGGEGEYRPGDISAAAPSAPAESPDPAGSPGAVDPPAAAGAAGGSPSAARRRVRYAYRGQEMSEFLQTICQLMLENKSRMAVVFYNILTTDIQNNNLRDNILATWEQSGRKNICVMLCPETLYNEEALVTRIQQVGLEGKFLTQGPQPGQSIPNPINCLRIAQPAADEIKYMLRYLSLVGDEHGRRLKFRYSDLDTLAGQVRFASEKHTRSLKQGFEYMSEIHQRFAHYMGQEPRDEMLTRETINQIYGVSGKNPAYPAERKEGRSGKAGWAVQRISAEIPNLEEEKTLDQLLEELDALVGLQEVKDEIRNLIAIQTANRWRMENGLPPVSTSLHMVFTGNPGTGKTTVARLIGHIYHAIGVLSWGETVDVGRDKLVANYVGQTAPKTSQAIESAKGGVLFIDEAYTLSEGGKGDFGQEAIDTLVKYMEDNREDLVVIVAGYPDKMRTFIDANDGLKSRFTKSINFDDYSADEMMEILAGMCKKSQYLLTDDASARAREIMQKGKNLGGKNFGNGRYVRNVYEVAVGRSAVRLAGMGTFTKQDACTLLPEDFVLPSNIKGQGEEGHSEEEKSTEELLEELDALVGLQKVKDEVRNLIAIQTTNRWRRENGLPPISTSLHMVFTGNPGTGKTTVARLIGHIYHAIGVLSRGQTVEVSREDLVAPYIGQTAQKTRAVLDRALGGVLFIDEAHTLASDFDFGQEAVDTILRYMENNRDDLVVILAGCPDEMKRFIGLNPGLAARFTIIEFED